MKKCLGCGEVKPLDDFHKAKHGKHGRASKCKACASLWHRDYNSKQETKEMKGPRARAYAKKWRAENPEKAREIYKTWSQRDPVQALGKNLRRALRRRPTENHATIKDLIEIYKAQNGLCALSGIKMTWGRGAYFPTSMSIDRIDSKLGYVKENIRLLCYAVNAMKGVWGDDHVIEISRGIVNLANASRKDPSWEPFPAFTDESDHMRLQ